MKLYAVVSGYFYNEIAGICSEDFIDQVMTEMEGKENSVRFTEITDSEWETYEEWIKNRNEPIHKDILSRPRLIARKVTGWRLE